MKHALRLGRWFGVDVFVHWTFLLLVAWVFFEFLSIGAGILGALYALALLAAVFLCVILHELGHSLAARRFGIQTRHITLLPIGGVASLTGMPRRPLHELVIALAGPAVNVLIAVLLTPFAFLVGGIFLHLLIANLILVLFNLIPAFPMDGGRVFRALLAMKLAYVKATAIAARTGQVLAALIAILGLYYLHNPMTLLVAAFVFFAAAAELRAVRHSRYAPAPSPQHGIDPYRAEGPAIYRVEHPGGQYVRVLWGLAPPVTQPWNPNAGDPPIRDVTPRP
ncbi:MAG TPA: site-2 protease family protein [Verrucomicrobiales bacterium]|nr:site-2 protease family protein [Verrucomicrobiales bacterium]